MGELMPRRLVHELLTTVAVPPASIALPLFDRDGLRIAEIDTPSGPWWATAERSLGSSA